MILGKNASGEEERREIREIIHGDCFVCRHDDNGNFMPVKEEDIETVRHFVKSIISIHDNVLIIEE